METSTTSWSPPIAQLALRATFADVFKPDIDVRKCKFVWLGTRQKFDDAFTFIFEKTEHGWMWAHAYQFDRRRRPSSSNAATGTWRRFRLRGMTRGDSIATCERIFAWHLGGHPLMSNAAHLRGSAWLIPRVLCERWSHKNLALMGDAAASAHFSIGSGTKLALESAVALADYLHSGPDLPAAFAKYGTQGAGGSPPAVRRAQFAGMVRGRRALPRLDPVQFNYSLLTRSQRISHENLRLRDPAWLSDAEAGSSVAPARPTMPAPHADVRTVLVCATMTVEEPRRRLADGAIQGGRGAARPTGISPTTPNVPKGGAGLVTIEMTCVSPEGRITPGCPGLTRPSTSGPGSGWSTSSMPRPMRRSVPRSAIPGPKGSTNSAGQMPTPLAPDNWAPDSGFRRRLVAGQPSPQARWTRRHGHGCASSSWPRRRWRRCGFDMLGSMRARLPAVILHLAGLTNVHRRVWRLLREPDALSAGGLPRRTCGVAARKPISVRISASDWVGDDGVTPGRAVGIASTAAGRRRRHLDVSAGQTPLQQTGLRPHVFQRRFPIASATGPAWRPWRSATSTSPTTSISIPAGGRADLVCLARPHLADPLLDLACCGAMGDRDVKWPDPYLPVAIGFYRLGERTATTGMRV